MVNKKGIMIFLMVFLVATYISACGNSTKQESIDDYNLYLSPPDEPFYFTGTIEEMIDEDRAIVLASIVENNPEGLVFVNLSVNKNEKFQVGNKVKVGFDGTIMESSPAKINTLSVELVD